MKPENTSTFVAIELKFLPTFYPCSNVSTPIAEGNGFNPGFCGANYSLACPPQAWFAHWPHMK
jgi:hypothetical protein